jgi:D-3-phosphoglycerate dehydrogenase
VALAENLGLFAGQIVDDGLEAVEIEYEGDVARVNTRPLSAALLAGLLRPMLQEVNMVSAPAVLKERGIGLKESKRETSPTYDSLIRVRVQTGGKTRTVAGAVMAGAAKIVEVKGMALEAPFTPVTLFINNSDQPGFIGALGTALGAAGINIADFHLGREAAGADAIALVGVDQVVPEAVQAQLRALPQVRYVKVLRF